MSEHILVQYLRDYQTFAGTARYWTETFAKTSSLGVEEKVKSLSFGFACCVHDKSYIVLCLRSSSFVTVENESVCTEY